MLQALFHNKLGHAIQGGSFRGIEDTLTSSVFGLLQYLPDDLFWEVLRGSCGASSETLPDSIGTIQNVHFWERLGAEGTHNTQSVEPDVWIETDQYDVVIEAKKSDSPYENAQHDYQWFNEIVALQNSYDDQEEKELLFLAIGGNSTLQDQEIFVRDNTQVIHTASWFDLLRGVLRLRERLGREQNSGLNLLRILDDVVTAMQYHNIVHTIWFDSLLKDTINKEAITTISHDWMFNVREFFDEIIGKGYRIAIDSLSGIWTIK